MGLFEISTLVPVSRFVPDRVLRISASSTVFIVTMDCITQIAHNKKEKGENKSKQSFLHIAVSIYCWKDTLYHSDGITAATATRLTFSQTN